VEKKSRQENIYKLNDGAGHKSIIFNICVWEFHYSEYSMVKLGFHDYTTFNFCHKNDIHIL